MKEVYGHSGKNIIENRLGIMSSYVNKVSVEDFNELITRLDAVSNIVSIIINALGDTQPVIHKGIISNIKEMVESMRNTLGEVDEDDIAEYAWSVTENMEQFLPFDEDELK